MSQSNHSVRRADPAIKWLVGGGLAAMGGGIFFLMFLASELTGVGPSGANGILGIGVAACLGFGAVLLGPVDRAVGKRILGGVEGTEVDEEIHDLRLQVEEMRGALAESQERLDFTERLLAGTKDRVPEELH